MVRGLAECLLFPGVPVLGRARASARARVRVVLRSLLVIFAWVVAACGGPATASQQPTIVRDDAPRSETQAARATEQVGQDQGRRPPAAGQVERYAADLYARLRPSDQELAALVLAAPSTTDLETYVRSFAALVNGAAAQARALVSRMEPVSATGSVVWSFSVDVRAGEIFDAAAAAMIDVLEPTHMPAFQLTDDAGRVVVFSSEVQEEARARLLVAAHRIADPIECSAIERYTRALETARASSLPAASVAAAREHLSRHSAAAIQRCAP